MRGRLLCALLLAAAAWQAVLFVRMAAHRYDLDLATSRLLHGEAAPATVDAAIWAYRDLPALVDRIPADERVLFLTSSPMPGPWPFYLLPHPFRILQRFPEELLDHVDAIRHGFQVQRGYDRIEERGMRLTPERLEDALAWADWLVVLFEDVELPADAPCLQLVARREHATLLRVLRDDGDR